MGYFRRVALRAFFRFSGVLLFFMGISVQAEPWLAQRFSKNCTACHAPGRVNKPLNAKRFSMSCDSCHENPNGGGLRNHYGKWLQENWLKSHVVNRWVGSAPPPAPIDQQLYSAEYPEPVKPKNQSEPKRKSMLKGVYPLVRSIEAFEDEKRHTPKVDQGHHLSVDRPELFELYIPEGDPYRKEKKRRIQVGGDLKYFVLNTKVDDQSETETLFSADAGLSFKILKRPDLKAVFEYRYLHDPNLSIWGTDENQDGILRSAYLKYDDMAYDTYVMGGVYRPMFGLYRAAPFSLRETMTFLTIGGPMEAVYEAISFGGQPGGRVLFNLSLLSSLTDTGDGSEGYIINLGGFLPYYGLNGMVSFWNTYRSAGTRRMAKQMLSLSGGFNLENRWIGNSEILFFKEDVNPSLPIRNSGYVGQVDLKRSLWRQYYANFNVSWANTARDLSEGSSVEVGLGLKAYLISSLEMELMYMQGTEKRVSSWGAAAKVDYGQIFLQTHLYW